MPAIFCLQSPQALNIEALAKVRNCATTEQMLGTEPFRARVAGSAAERALPLFILSLYSDPKFPLYSDPKFPKFLKFLIYSYVTGITER